MRKIHNFNILIVDDDTDYRHVLELLLSNQGYGTLSASDAAEAMALIRQHEIDLMITDYRMKGMDGIALLNEVRRSNPGISIIIITAYGSVEKAVEAMRQGAFTYVIKGSDPEELLLEIEKIKHFRHLELENRTLKKQTNQFDFMLNTHHGHFRHLIETAKRAADSNANILVLGESGVGKEVLARYIHQNSSREANQFMAVNCHVFSDSVLESELFGHEKGSFTGAVARRIGRFEAADGGTLFLDEVGDMPLSTQAKLLRVLENHEIERIGSNQPLSVDFRLIAATHKNLDDEIRKGRFREDLYFRIATIVLEVPPLRERREDLPLYIDYFINQIQQDLKKQVSGMEPAVERFLLEYRYPGNIREMRNIIERLIVLSSTGTLMEKDLPTPKSPTPATGKPEAASEAFETFSEGGAAGSFKPLRVIRQEAESRHIQEVLKQCDYNVSEASRILEISHRQLNNKINEYGLRTPARN
ncbi:sigma-54 dependent transcriptional regulator [Anoxynatronum sibiricum]|uniref:Stage 0 sporulation protein A homolog n=1 Tax=Anoxynatronum sibiricum TaxID=210623 RepID=A0ABU9VTC9_9CLOT